MSGFVILFFLFDKLLITVACPKNSRCWPDGPALVQCLCTDDYHGYKCLKKVSSVSAIGCLQVTRVYRANSHTAYFLPCSARSRHSCPAVYGTRKEDMCSRNRRAIDYTLGHTLMIPCLHSNMKSILCNRVKQASRVKGFSPNKVHRSDGDYTPVG
jgi:hypothetical protein